MRLSEVPLRAGRIWNSKSGQQWGVVPQTRERWQGPSQNSLRHPKCPACAPRVKTPHGLGFWKTYQQPLTSQPSTFPDTSYSCAQMVPEIQSPHTPRSTHTTHPKAVSHGIHFKPRCKLCFWMSLSPPVPMTSRFPWQLM